MSELDSEWPDDSGRTAAEGMTPDMIGVRLAALAAGQTAMNSALGLMLDTLQAQTSLLRTLAEYASETPGPSPVLKYLGELTSAVMDMDASIGSLEKKFDRLADTIAAAYKIGPDTRSPSAANGGIS